jgi:hypothetical protein
MKNLDLKNLCLSLIKAESEIEVIENLKANDLWDDLSLWRDYGDESNNWAIAGNQQGRPETALVEKLVNSIDSILIKECKIRGIDPEGPDAPSTLKGAVKGFFGIENGDITNLTGTERSELSKSIGLVSTGKKGRGVNSNYVIFDFGEGQSPDSFSDTFMSIGKSNKMKIPFVQGKFNMGGTGVLRFCGTHNFQFVLSKRNPDLLKGKNKDDNNNLWGFTIVRRIFPKGNIRSSKYVYLAPQGRVLSFAANKLPILPSEYPKPYGGDMQYGSYIKLFEYQTHGLKSNILFDLYYRLSLLLPTISLPVRMYERRVGFTGHGLEGILNGLSVRLQDDRSNNLEVGWPTTHQLSIMNEKMNVTIYAFKRNSEIQNFVKSERIVFIINGQTHGYLGKSFFSRKSVGLGNLSDSLIILINCTEISGSAREDLFMNSRDRLVESGKLRNSIEQELEILLREHEGLKLLKHKRYVDDINDRLDDSKPLSDILERIMRGSPVLSKLFVSGKRLSNPINMVPDDVQYKGKKFPTYFRLVKKFPINNPKNVEVQNKRIKIKFETDVANDYFDRENDNGTHSLFMDEIPFVFNKSISLYNGVATLNIEIPDYVQENEILSFRSIVSDVNSILPFENEFHVRVIKNSNVKDKQENKEKDPVTNKLALPKIVKINKEKWETHDFNKESALKVEFNGDLGWVFYVNVDNIHLLSEIKAKPYNMRLIEAQYVYSLVLFGISMINKLEEDTGDDKDIDKNIDIPELIRTISKGVSPILIPMINTLGSDIMDATIIEEHVFN